MRRRVLRFSICSVLVGMIAPTSLYAQQSLSVYVGEFTPHAEDGRRADDVLFAHLNDGRYSLGFGIDDFRNATIGAEWLGGVGNHVAVSVGAGFYRRRVETAYASFVNTNGRDIEQVLRLQIIPVTATIQLLPLGQSASVRPYIGAGVGVFVWRFIQDASCARISPPPLTCTRGFVRRRDNAIFLDRFEDSGTAAGPVVQVGVRFGVGSAALGGEIRYQRSAGDLSSDFLAPKIDLAGFNYLLSVGFHF